MSSFIATKLDILRPAGRTNWIIGQKTHLQTKPVSAIRLKAYFKANESGAGKTGSRKRPCLRAKAGTRLAQWAEKC